MRIVPTRIDSLTIKGVRGLKNAALHFDGKGLFLYGENGVGKSSVIDSLEFLFTGEIAHLSGTQGLSTKSHGKHVDVGVKEMGVFASFRSPEGSISRELGASPKVSPELTEFYDSLHNGGFILRRGKLLDFIAEQPAGRSRALEGLMGIENLNTVELAVIALRDDTLGSMKSADAQTELLRATLAQEAGIATDPPSPLYRIVNIFLQNASLPLLESDLDIEKPPSEDLATTSRLQTHIQLITTLEHLLSSTLLPDSVRTALSNVLSDIRQIDREAVAKAARASELLRGGLEEISAHDADTCPICEQTIDREATLARLAARIHETSLLSEKATKIRSGLSECIARLQSPYNSSVEAKSLAEKSESMPELTKFLSCRNGELAKLMDALKELRELSPVPGIEERIKNVYDLEADVKRFLQDCQEQLKTFQGSAVALRAKALWALGQAKIVLGEQARSTHLKQTLELSESCVNLVSNSKRETVLSVYAEIQQEVTRLYLRIHPSEDHGNVTLKLGRRASTELRVRSFGHDEVDPRAYSSEGHLDTLGLCIFLALYAKLHQNAPLLVLDDVLSSVDANHRLRVAGVLLTEFNDRQLIVSTHDWIWFEELLRLADSMHIRQDFHSWRVVRWTREFGPEFRPYSSRRDRIRELMATDEIGLAGNEARQYLESTLAEICERTEAPIAYRADNRHDPGPLLDAAGARFSKILREDSAKTLFAEDIRQLRATVFLANLLSHNNEVSGVIASGDLSAFMCALESLRGHFRCAGCGSPLLYSQDVHVLGCPKGACASRTSFQTV